MNYFELFEIPVSIKIDKSTLAQKYFDIQKKYHPDFFAQGTEAEQADALEQSSAANKALKIFKNEDETIKYVLQLKGLLEEEEKYQLPPEFLMEMMELNEELSENRSEIHLGVETLQNAVTYLFSLFLCRLSIVSQFKSRIPWRDEQSNQQCRSKDHAFVCFHKFA